MLNLFRDRDHRTVIVAPRDSDDFIRIPFKMITYIFGWTEIIFNTFFIFEILARLGELFATHEGDIFVDDTVCRLQIAPLPSTICMLTIKKLDESNLEFV